MEPLAPRLILVPTDFSATAAHALRYASNLARRFDAHLLVVHADPHANVTAETLRRHAEECVKSGIPCDVRVVANTPVDAIVDQVREVGANLIVMGTHGRTGVSRLLFGSVTEATMRVAPVPVISVNPRTAEYAMIDKVLCPVDYTSEGANALRHAAALVDARRAPLVLVSGVDQIGRAFDELPRLRAWVPPDLVDRCELKLMNSGASSREILSLAGEVHADLIALGVPSDRCVADSLRGTTVERIVQHSNCPVLTVNARVTAVTSCCAAPHLAELAPSLP